MGVIFLIPFFERIPNPKAIKFKSLNKAAYVVYKTFVADVGKRKDRKQGRIVVYAADVTLRSRKSSKKYC